MVRRSNRRSARSARATRKTRWQSFTWQALDLLMDTTPGQSNWGSFWARWPSGSFDPESDRVTPSDETLIRYVGECVCGVGIGTLVPGSIPPQEICFGLIAYDGGNRPEYYELNVYSEAVAAISPPNPILDAFDDWIIRLPFQFLANGGFQGTGVESFIQSRAMRKLPPSVGVLAVVAALSVVPDGGDVYNVSFGWDGRLAYKSGYTV